MPSFSISQFIILLEPLWVPAVFLLLSTGPITYIIVMAFCCIVCYYSTMMVIKYNNTGSTTTNVRWIKMSWIFFQIPLNYVIYILFEIEKIWGVAAGKREVK